MAELVRQRRVRELRGIGPGIESATAGARRDGKIAEESSELEREVPPDLVGLGRFLGLSSQRTLRDRARLGVRTRGRAAGAAAGAGSTPRRSRRRAEDGGEAARAPERRDSASARRLLLSHARAIVTRSRPRSAEESAGDVRRWKDEPHRLAVVVPSEPPGAVLGAFAAARDRGRRRAARARASASRSTASPVEAIVAEPDRFGTELLRATGAEGYVQALEPLPDAAR